MFSSFMLAFLVSMVVGIAIPDAMTMVTGFVVRVFFAIVAIRLMDAAVKKEMKDLHTELRDSGEFDDLKNTLMAEAKRMAEKQSGRDPDRRLAAVCHNCDNDIYSDDKMYTNGKQNCYCDICWDLDGARE